MAKSTNTKRTIAAATISLALVASLAPTAAFAATDASELPIAVTMAAQAATQASVSSSASAFADTLHTLIADEAAKVYTAHAQAQGLDADAAIATVYGA